MFKKSKILQKIRERRNDGFTIVEAVITIPMLALVGGTLFLFMAQSILLISENNTAAVAGGKVKMALDEVRNVKTCEDLKEMINPTYIKDEDKGYYIEIKPFVKGVDQKTVDGMLLNNLEDLRDYVYHECTASYSAINAEQVVNGSSESFDPSVLIIATAKKINNSDDKTDPDKVLFTSSAQAKVQGVI